MTAEHSTKFAAEPPPVEQARRLYRSTQNRVLAGVCGGIAEYYGSDPTAVRLATLLIGLFTGIVPMLVLYLIAAVIVPDRLVGEAGDRLQRRVGTGSGALVFGAILIVVGLAGFANEWLRVDWNLTWPFVLVGLGLTVLVLAMRRP